MLPHCPASSTHQTEYLNDSALMLPKPVVYPVTLTQQTEYVQNDSLMMPEPARLLVNLMHHHGPFLSELNDVTNIDTESPTTGFVRTFTSL